MNGLELLVVVVGGLAGYWVVSFLMKSRASPSKPEQAGESQTDSSEQQRSDPA